MKKFGAGCAAVAALLCIVEAAPAADMAAKARPAMKHDPCGAARFSGAYVGGNAGAIAYTALSRDPNNLMSDNPTEYTDSRIGVTAGIQAGYDWQSCNKVFGIVADWNWADASTVSQVDPNSPGVRDNSFRGQMHWFSTIRARAGVAVNDALFYVTGGVAVADIRSTATRNAFSLNDQFSAGGTRWGLAAGVGAEFALRDNWSLNTELLYMQFRRDGDTFVSFPNTAFERLVSVERNDSAWVGRVGLNYRWDNPRAAYAAANVQGAAPVYPCGPARFNGGYIGGNAGAIGYTALRQDRDGGFADNGDYSATATGFIAGVQLGWDWQSCNALLGIVADWNWTSVDATARITPNALGPVDRFAAGSIDGFGTLRARAGLAVDDVLLYVTGGLAAARIKSTIADIRPGNDAPDENDRAAFADTRLGFVGGFGAEFALAGGWSANTELLYLQFRKSTDTFDNVAIDRRANVENHDSAWVTRAGLNYRWDNARGVRAAATGASVCGPARFNGPYAGGNVGAIRRTALTRDQDAFFIAFDQYTETRGVVSAGIQAGYDWQSCNKVFGIVADWNMAKADTSVAIRPNDGDVKEQSIRTSMDWFSTVRARAGIAVNDALVYVTGGLAVTEIGSTVTSNIVLNRQLSSSSTRLGWTGGFGAEYALANGWSVNGEALYLQFRKDNDTFLPPTGGAFSFEQRDSAWVGRLGVNYRFGAGG